MKLNVHSLPLAGVKLIRCDRIVDERGYFAEVYVRRDFVTAGLDTEFIQDNQSCSNAAGTVRGLHFQSLPYAQTKLIRVLRGRIYDVIVDLRRSSPSYSQYIAVELSQSGGEQLFVPPGFAHGFCALEANTEVLYKVDNAYSREHDRGIHWADPALDIRWPVAASEAVLSERDTGLPLLRDLPTYFV